MSVVTYEKPIPHIGLSDWYAKQWEIHQTNDTRRNDAFNLRHESRQLRNETNVRSQWDTYHNNVRLSNRITEVDRWKELLTACLRKLNQELAVLKDDKFKTERELDALGIPMSVVSECISMRDGRQSAELTYDDGDTELKKELCLVEDVKRQLIERCQATWEKINKLEEVRYKLNLDISDKHETLEIDNDQLNQDRHSANITFKIDPLRIVKGSITYEAWLEQTELLKQLADNELADSQKLRESLFVITNRCRNDLLAQKERVDFTLRKRIYETQRSRNEIEWHQLKMREEMDKVSKEIMALENSIGDKNDSLKLAETRLENRSYRPGFELARDDPEQGLKDEVLQLRQTLRELTDKINCAKATYNALEEQQVFIDRDLQNKMQSLMTDIRCLDLRARLKSGEYAGPATETDRNIQLTKMEQEIPPN